MLPPRRTTAEASITPVCRRFPINSSTYWSVHFCLKFTTLEPPRQSVVNHFQCHNPNHEAEDDSQPACFGVSQNPRPNQGTNHHPQHDGHCQAGINVSPAEVDAGTCGSRHTDHKVAGGG